MRRKNRNILLAVLPVCLLGGVCSAVPVHADTAGVTPPVLSLQSGFYAGEQHLTITSDPNTVVYYTTDGSFPDTSSFVYSDAIILKDISSSANVLSARTDIQPEERTMWGISKAKAPVSPVDKANVIRAVAVDSEGNISNAVTGTYFIDYQNKKSYYQNLKVFSFVTDSDNLFDYETGIYVLGKVHDDWKNGSEFDASVPAYFMPANYTQKGKEWEREAVMQIFQNGNLTLSQNIGIRIHGGATRSQPQKSLNVYARKTYGAGSLSYDLFSGSVTDISGNAVQKFDSFILRDGGNDASYSRWR
ncbi:MAG: chitobiase/beta-hexosaminidase C-terminal domain-containing protein, partial [Oscillospiraceae bacterium]|nr:chitobiase/beta-hexosaminidase C-terminal domain-containing protein [Oscillospiraceae bacterium]